MKSLPLQMQQNLILAATLIGGVLFAPQTITKPRTEGSETWNRAAHSQASYGIAASFSKNPETGRRIGDVEMAGETAVQNPPARHAVVWPSNVVPARTQPSAAGFIPQAVQGEWVSNSYSSLSPSALDDEAATSRFSFLTDGRYSYVYAVRQRSHGRAIVSTTVEEGSVSFNKDGTFVMSPDRGYFQGNSEGGYVCRALDPAELGTRIMHWGWRTASGKKSLYLGPSAKAASAYLRSQDA